MAAGVLAAMTCCCLGLVDPAGSLVFDPVGSLLVADPLGSSSVLVVEVCSPVLLVVVLAWRGFLAEVAAVLESHVRRELLDLLPPLVLLPCLGVFLLLAGSHLVFLWTASSKLAWSFRSATSVQWLPGQTTPSREAALPFLLLPALEHSPAPCIQLSLPAGSSSSPWPGQSSSLVLQPSSSLLLLRPLWTFLSSHPPGRSSLPSSSFPSPSSSSRLQVVELWGP